MRIGAYQFAVSGCMNNNYESIRQAIVRAASEGVEVLAFPECALTGYPPHDMADSASVDFLHLELVYTQLQQLADKYNMHLIVGSIEKVRNGYTNCALLFSPGQKVQRYNKRALWGWDRENFWCENAEGIFEINGYKLGIRICFEIRFPEFFRELYKRKTDLNIVLFYDVSAVNDLERYDLIRSHIRTRAVENVTYTLSVNSCSNYQTAPTGLYDRSGAAVCELERNRSDMLIFDLENTELSFGEMGRKEISDSFEILK